MFTHLYPHNYIKSIDLIPFKKLRKAGYRGIIFDIDNTLVEHGAPADERSIVLFQELKKLGYQTVLLSNNKEARVKPFGDAVSAKYISRAGKPGVKNYRKAMKMMGTDEKTTLFVGDQLFTDIWGARRSGLRTYLVQPINKKEEIQIILKRCPEKVVLFFYKRKCRRENRTFLQGEQ